MLHSIFKWKRFPFALSICFFLIVLFVESSCKKEWLDAKPEKKLAVPTTLHDFQALLNQTLNDAPAFNDWYGMIAELGAGDGYVDDNDYNGASILERNAYTWNTDLYGSEANYAEWILPYRQVYYTNIVLEGIEKITPKNNSEQLDWNQARASALFFRAFAHYDIARQFCKPYIKNSASSDLGIPLRLQSDFNETSVRSTVEQTYQQIIKDLKESVLLLPISAPVNVKYKYQPNKSAVYAMLGRVYLSMSEYDSAFVYADKSLQLYNTLLDYNGPLVNLGAFGPFPSIDLNPEILFYKRGNSWILTDASIILADPGLYQLYTPNDDLRSIAFYYDFGGIYLFCGSYGDYDKFTGLATDEVYLIRAECNARLGRKTEALNDLNTLLVKRWANGTFVPITATDANDALRKIIIERRKELCFRSLRWEDLRRLNQDPQFAVTLSRVVNGQTYSLPPNSNLYVLPFPEDVIRLTGMPQNPRP